MNVLKDKSYKTYAAVSRYTPFPYYYNTDDNKYIYGLTGQLSTNTPYVDCKLSAKDTLDSLSLLYYGRPDYFWIIADFNHIKDPLEDIHLRYNSLKIPTLSSISYSAGR